jgi:DoxX-like family
VEVSKRNTLIYWALTVLLMVPGAGGGLIELLTNGPEPIVETMLALGYPLYLMKILGFAKVLGGIAILTGKIPRLKEWAYAGFAFDFLGAAASHVLANDAINAVAPLVFFAVLMVSYVLWYKTSATPTPSFVSKRYVERSTST